MVAMGRALMMDPSVLLLDEPSAGLSPAYQDEVFIRCRRINATGVSIIMVEQNARRCLQICDRGYVLDQGRNAYTGTGAVADARPQGHRALPGHARQGPVADAQPPTAPALLGGRRLRRRPRCRCGALRAPYGLSGAATGGHGPPTVTRDVRQCRPREHTAARHRERCRAAAGVLAAVRHAVGPGWHQRCGPMPCALSSWMIREDSSNPMTTIASGLEVDHLLDLGVEVRRLRVVDDGLGWRPRCSPASTRLFGCSRPDRCRTGR